MWSKHMICLWKAEGTELTLRGRDHGRVYYPRNIVNVGLIRHLSLLDGGTSTISFLHPLCFRWPVVWCSGRSFLTHSLTPHRTCALPSFELNMMSFVPVSSTAYSFSLTLEWSSRQIHSNLCNPRLFMTAWWSGQCTRLFTADSQSVRERWHQLSLSQWDVRHCTAWLDYRDGDFVGTLFKRHNSSLVCMLGITYVYIDTVFGLWVRFSLIHLYCLVGCVSMIVWTHAVWGV